MSRQLTFDIVVLDSYFSEGFTNKDMIKMAEKLGYFEITFEHGYDPSCIVAKVFREETYKEEAARIRREEFAKQEAEEERALEYQHYLKLKEKFEGDH